MSSSSSSQPNIVELDRAALYLSDFMDGVSLHDRVESLSNIIYSVISNVLFRDQPATVFDEDMFNYLIGPRKLRREKIEDPIAQRNMNLWPCVVIGTPGVKSRKSPIVYTIIYNNNEYKVFSDERNSSKILVKLKESSETYLDTAAEDNVVIIVPAYFNSAQRQATKEAGAIAGFSVVCIIIESTDSAIANGLHKEPTRNMNSRTQNILVFDPGGETFDAAYCMVMQTGELEVQVLRGDTCLGGLVFDSIIVDIDLLSAKSRPQFEDLNLDHDQKE